MFATHPRLAVLATVITPINMLLVKRTGKTVPGQHLNMALSVVLWRFREIWGDGLWKHRRFWNVAIGDKKGCFIFLLHLSSLAQIAAPADFWTPFGMILSGGLLWCGTKSCNGQSECSCCRSPGQYTNGAIQCGWEAGRISSDVFRLQSTNCKSAYLYIIPYHTPFLAAWGQWRYFLNTLPCDATMCCYSNVLHQLWC